MVGFNLKDALESWRVLFGLLSFLMMTIALKAQVVSNVTAQQQGQNIVIHYHLETTSPCTVQLWMSENGGGTWVQLQKGLSGDVVKIHGGDHAICWNVLSFKEHFVSNECLFKVKVIREVMDIDGNVYTIVSINGRDWIQENLRVTRYRNGDKIPTCISNIDWSNTTNGALGFYDNDSKNILIYGNLYNWFAVNDKRGLCPLGWHVPTDKEWTLLENYLGGSEIAGGKMKSIDFWNLPNAGATEHEKFKGVASGCRLYNGKYCNVGSSCYWWSSTESVDQSAWYRKLSFDDSNIVRTSFDKESGFSVRCISD